MTGKSQSRKDIRTEFPGGMNRKCKDPKAEKGLGTGEPTWVPQGPKSRAKDDSGQEGNPASVGEEEARILF